MEKYNKIQLTKNKMDLNNQKMTNHPPSPEEWNKIKKQTKEVRREAWVWKNSKAARKKKEKKRKKSRQPIPSQPQYNTNKQIIVIFYRNRKSTMKFNFTMEIVNGNWQWQTVVSINYQVR